jgi:response regulator of citrate/malate metabolism
LSTNELVDIFGEDLLNKPTLNSYFEELTGIADVKPFECVGTIEEVNEAIKMIIPYQKDKYLIQNYITKTNNK